MNRKIGKSNLSLLQFPGSKARVKKWAEEASAKAPDGHDFHMEIEVKETKEVIGMIAAHETDPRNGTFEYGIAIRETFQRKGYATEAVVLLLRYFFDDLRYQKCNSNVHGWNDGSKKLQEKLGFTLEGQIRRANYSEGQYYDKFIYGMTIEEFRERYD